MSDEREEFVDDPVGETHEVEGSDGITLVHTSSGLPVKALRPIPGAQTELLGDMTSHVIAFIGGMSSGKTHALVMKALWLGWMNPGAIGMFVEPTYQLIKDVALATFEKVLVNLGVYYHWHATFHDLTIGKGPLAFTIHMRSGEKPNRLIGSEKNFTIIDEPGLQKREVFARSEQRTRRQGRTPNQIVLGGTPEGFNWLYDICEKRPLSGLRLLRARTVENPFRKYDYELRLRETCTPAEAEAYLEGRFVNLTSGRVYPSFARDTHGAPFLGDPWRAGEVVVGCDFNVGKMCWVIGVIVGDHLHIWAELVGRNTNTYRQTEALQQLLVDERRRRRPWEIFVAADILRDVTIYTDATGTARKTSANESDVAILRGAGARVIAAPANPPIRDRVYTVEQLMRRGALHVDVNAAGDLVHALESQGWGADGLPIKGEGEADVSGFCDALGYACWGRPGWRATVPRGNTSHLDNRVSSYA